MPTPTQPHADRKITQLREALAVMLRTFSRGAAMDPDEADAIRRGFEAIKAELPDGAVGGDHRLASGRNVRQYIGEIIADAIAFEVEPIALKQDDEGQHYCERIDDPENGETPDFWSVYGRDHDGMAFALVDCVQQDDAEITADLFRLVCAKVPE